MVTVRSGAGEPDAVRALWPRRAAGPAGPRTAVAGGDPGGGRRRPRRPGGRAQRQRVWRLTGGNALFLRATRSRTRWPPDGCAGWRGSGCGTDDVAVSQSITDMVAAVSVELPTEQATRRSTRCRSASRWPSTCCGGGRTHRPGIRRADAARQRGTLGNQRMARLAHPLYGELRRSSAGEMYLSRLRGKLAQLIGARRPPTPTRNLRWTAHSSRSTPICHPNPALFLDAARSLCDARSRPRRSIRGCRSVRGCHRSAAARLQAMNLHAGGPRRPDAGEFLEEFTADGRRRADRGRPCARRTLIWMHGPARRRRGHPRGARLGDRRRVGVRPCLPLALEACVDAVFARCVEPGKRPVRH